MIELLQRGLELIRNPGEIITLWGIAALILIVFAETGALVFFLPGDSLLVTAGLYAAAGKLDIVTLNLVLIPAAIVGDATSYSIGKLMGPLLTTKTWKFLRDRPLVRQEHFDKAKAFYEEHGGKAIIIARFAPLVRTFVPVVAGTAKMQYRRFAMFNVVGGAGWVLSMTLCGYFLGKVWPDIDKHIEKVIVLVVALSIGLPWAWAKMASKKKQAPPSTAA